MIAQLQGHLIHKSPTRAVVEVNGVGYELHIPLSTYEKLGGTGETSTLLTYLHVREDALQLYGFSTNEEKMLFQHLIAVSGIGPRLAQSILSGCSVATFCSFIRNNEIASLTAIPGIGKKTAERLIIELRDRLKNFAIAPAQTAAAPPLPVIEEAVLALVSLGYVRASAEKALRRAQQEEGELPVEDLIKRALRNL